MRRALPLLSAALLLAGCGSGEATFGGPTGSAAGPALVCDAPPEAPSTPLSFTADDLPEPMPAEPATVPATIRTTCGDIELELEAALAPQTVASFAFLAEQGYWHDSPCHRLTTSGIFVLQCGDPTGTGRGNPGYGYGIENAPADGSYPPGTLAMARTMDPDSNGGQFFIVYADTQLPTDGGGYSVFGAVTDGLEIVEALAAQGARGGSDGAPAQPISILSVDVED
ncbi:peptidylprolyl isomerase [Ornithinimicrobium tianjinense]|uniref:Peptidyl-prolyl cis-trans isomerase n=1 Tax=Ornithinimicrobium tianjinense TaxID=1195761 RepID=A0A917BK62_9MICO|nr:peptidylprolyl isomerase [Ornithinimicrobium tianjinense]GGF46862.1 peptidyl-prolyl cis-trans isomerase [Ornithinimicrobium tianjinense]